MGYYLYILKSSIKEKYYTGISENAEKRLWYHNNIEKGFTSRYRPWVIVLKKEFANKSQATEAERKIKSWKSKTMIEKILSGEIEL